MKKLFLLVIALLLLSAPASYAGDMDNDLLRNDQSKMFFGELTENAEFVVIKPIYNIKGEFDQDKMVRVLKQNCDIMGGQTAVTGKIYLCGLFSSQTDLCLWEFDTMDTSVIKLNATDCFSKKIQEYLNTGLFDKAEQDRLYKIHLYNRPKPSPSLLQPSGEMITLPSEPAQKQSKTVSVPWAAAICAGVAIAAVVLIIKRK